MPVAVFGIGPDTASSLQLERWSRSLGQIHETFGIEGTVPTVLGTRFVTDRHIGAMRSRRGQSSLTGRVRYSKRPSRVTPLTLEMAARCQCLHRVGCHSREGEVELIRMLKGAKDWIKARADS